MEYTNLKKQVVRVDKSALETMQFIKKDLKVILLIS